MGLGPELGQENGWFLCALDASERPIIERFIVQDENTWKRLIEENKRYGRNLNRTRARIRLRKSQLQTMVAGGVTRIQPGIESLSTSILRLMRKGTSRLQNIQLLKWCADLQLNVAWNFLPEWT